MRKVNTNNIAEFTWSSPKGKFAGANKEISEELGRKPQSMDWKGCQKISPRPSHPVLRFFASSSRVVD